MFKNNVFNVSVNTKKWAKAAFIRAIKTMAQTAGALLATGALLSDVDWAYVASASALAGILSLITSIAGIPEVEESEG